MEARYTTRKQQLLAECQVAPAIFDQVLPRLTTFMAPFVETFCRQELDQHAHTYICGLLSDVERKNIASIAYRFGQDRLPLQRFIGWAPWEDVLLRQELARQVAAHLGHADGVLVFDPSGFPKSGTESVGVQQFPLIPCECYATMVADSSASVSTIRFCLLKQWSGSDMTGCLVESGLV
jgi:DDE superfamily endonuclease